jgi:hypothetical protein
LPIVCGVERDRFGRLPIDPCLKIKGMHWHSLVRGQYVAETDGFLVLLNVWPAPSARVIFVWFCSVCFNVSGLGGFPRPRWSSAQPDPHNHCDLEGRSMVQDFKLPFDVRSSSFYLTQTSATRRDKRRSGNLLYAAAISHPES